METHVAKTGPDVIDVVAATWNNIAIPSILSGCETIPFSEETIEGIEKVQAQLAKRVLDLPLSTPNICAQTELGIKPFRLVLWQHQLSFYMRAMRLPPSRWVSSALVDHLSDTWASPYMAYISRVRECVGLLEMAPTEKYLRSHLDSWAVDTVNSKLADLSCHYVDPIKRISRELYVCESDGVSELAAFRLGSARLGHRVPFKGSPRLKYCPLCSAHLDERHVAFSCLAIENFRKNETEITFFRNVCRRKDIYEKEAFRRYLHGWDWNGLRVPQDEYVRRGAELKRLKKYWLSRIGYLAYCISLLLHLYS